MRLQGKLEAEKREIEIVVPKVHPEIKVPVAALTITSLGSSPLRPKREKLVGERSLDKLQARKGELPHQGPNASSYTAERSKVGAVRENQRVNKVRKIG